MKSASNTGLFLQCPAPFSSEAVPEKDAPGESARYGSAVHAILAGVPVETAIARFDVVLHRAEIEAHVARIQAAESEAFAGFELVGREVSRLYNLDFTTPRPALLNEETHEYTNLDGQPPLENEMGGTADVVYLGEHGRVVVDYKTGFGDFSRPASLPQLRTLGLMFEATHAAVIHAPRSAPVTVFIEPFEELFAPKHQAALAMAWARVGSGFYRSGPECKYCPARISCPLQSGEVLRENTQLLHLATGGGNTPLVADSTGMKGALFSFLQRLDPLEKQMRARLRADVEAGEIIYTPKGQLLQLVPKNKTNLSMASIRRALPPAEAEALIKTLDEKGCIERGETVELRAK